MTSLKIKEEFLEVKIDQVESMFDLNTAVASVKNKVLNLNLV